MVIGVIIITITSVSRLLKLVITSLGAITIIWKEVMMVVLTSVVEYKKTNI